MQFDNVMTNSLDPDQTPHNAASDLGLHCLQMSLRGMLDNNGLMGQAYFIIDEHVRKGLLVIFCWPTSAQSDQRFLWPTIYFTVSKYFARR